MEDFRLIRVDIGDEWERRKLVALFRESLRKNGLVSDDYLYHAFDANASVNGATAIDLIGLIGCETRAPELSESLRLHDESGAPQTTDPACGPVRCADRGR